MSEEIAYQFKLLPVVSDREEASPIHLIESYQKLLKSKIQLEITTNDENTVIDAIDQNDKAITFGDLLGLPSN